MWRSWFGDKADESASSLDAEISNAMKNHKKDESSMPADVKSECDRAFDKSTDDSVRVLGLRKVFPPPSRGVPPKVAVKSFSLGVKKFECITLLGHNGAGKTTLINMLTGLFPPTDGSALYTSSKSKRTWCSLFFIY